MLKNLPPARHTHTHTHLHTVISPYTPIFNTKRPKTDRADRQAEEEACERVALDAQVSELRALLRRSRETIEAIRLCDAETEAPVPSPSPAAAAIAAASAAAAGGAAFTSVPGAPAVGGGACGGGLPEGDISLLPAGTGGIARSAVWLSKDRQAWPMAAGLHAEKPGIAGATGATVCSAWQEQGGHCLRSLPEGAWVDRRRGELSAARLEQPGSSKVLCGSLDGIVDGGGRRGMWAGAGAAGDLTAVGSGYWSDGHIVNSSAAAATAAEHRRRRQISASPHGGEVFSVFGVNGCGRSSSSSMADRRRDHHGRSKDRMVFHEGRRARNCFLRSMDGVEGKEDHAVHDSAADAAFYYYYEDIHGYDKIAPTTTANSRFRGGSGGRRQRSKHKKRAKSSSESEDEDEDSDEGTSEADAEGGGRRPLSGSKTRESNATRARRRRSDERHAEARERAEAAERLLAEERQVMARKLEAERARFRAKEEERHRERQVSVCGGERWGGARSCPILFFSPAWFIPQVVMCDTLVLNPPCFFFARDGGIRCTALECKVYGV